MTIKELRDAIYDEFVSKYYQSALCQDADNYEVELCNFGKISIEENTFELLEELADATISVMQNNNILKAKKQECEI